MTPAIWATLTAAIIGPIFALWLYRKLHDEKDDERNEKTREYQKQNWRDASEGKMPLDVFEQKGTEIPSLKKEANISNVRQTFSVEEQQSIIDEWNKLRKIIFANNKEDQFSTRDTILKVEKLNEKIKIIFLEHVCDDPNCKVKKLQKEFTKTRSEISQAKEKYVLQDRKK